jgi:hypothetical protein
VLVTEPKLRLERTEIKNGRNTLFKLKTQALCDDTLPSKNRVDEPLKGGCASAIATAISTVEILQRRQIAYQTTVVDCDEQTRCMNDLPRVVVKPANVDVVSFDRTSFGNVDRGESSI